MASTTHAGSGYLCGGYAAGGLSSVLELQPAADGGFAWVDVPAMPTPRFNGCATSVEGKIYVAGGCVHDSHGASASMDCFDLSSSTWSAAPLMGSTRIGAAAASLHGNVYIMGGVSGDGPLNSVEVFNPLTGCWSEGPVLQVPRAAACAALLRI